MICPDALQVNTSICPGVSMNTYLWGPRGSCRAFEGGPWNSSRGGGVSGSGQIGHWTAGRSPCQTWLIEPRCRLVPEGKLMPSHYLRHSRRADTLKCSSMAPIRGNVALSKEQESEDSTKVRKYIRETCAPPAPTTLPTRRCISQELNVALRSLQRRPINCTPYQGSPRTHTSLTQGHPIASPGGPGPGRTSSRRG